MDQAYTKGNDKTDDAQRFLASSALLKEARACLLALSWAWHTTLSRIHYSLTYPDLHRFRSTYSTTAISYRSRQFRYSIRLVLYRQGSHKWCSSSPWVSDSFLSCWFCSFYFFARFLIVKKNKRRRFEAWWMQVRMVGAYYVSSHPKSLHLCYAEKENMKLIRNYPENEKWIYLQSEGL